jgi:hypothetical protein
MALATPVIRLARKNSNHFSLLWPAVTGANHYHMDIAYDSGFTNMMFTATNVIALADIVQYKATIIGTSEPSFAGLNEIDAVYNHSGSYNIAGIRAFAINILNYITSQYPGTKYILRGFALIFRRSIDR